MLSGNFQGRTKIIGCSEDCVTDHEGLRSVVLNQMGAANSHIAKAPAVSQIQ